MDPSSVGESVCLLRKQAKFTRALLSFAYRYLSPKNSSSVVPNAPQPPTLRLTEPRNAKSKCLVWCRLPGKTTIFSPSVGLLGLPAPFTPACKPDLVKH